MPELDANHNQLAYSVSEIAGALKRVVEDTFGHVRVRGEISGWKGPASSGHAYFRLKDEKAVLEAVCWRGTMSKMPVKLEEGLEVIASGKITTYPGSSKYQIVIDSIEPAGIGALMALLEKRKQQLAAEGLFDPQRKRPLPFMPRVIGVVTSPTGAVIRDILHRISDRFPTHVLVWPVAVQGEAAAGQIAKAIEGFNALGSMPPADDPAGDIEGGLFAPARSRTSAIPRPDLIIVARGGGSLEDLWAFNEEIVVRAAANSKIPLISAVGHETDTTLIDYASDMRAPTPTAAAEMAVPVHEEIRLTIMEYGSRSYAAWTRFLHNRGEAVAGLVRGLTHPQRMIDVATQRLDDWSERLAVALPTMLAQKSQLLAVAAAQLQLRSISEKLSRHEQDLLAYAERMSRMMLRGIGDREQKLISMVQLMESLSPMRVLERGFVLVKDSAGKLVSRALQMKQGDYTLVFHDGNKVVTSAD
jgi:exodeoxyribonuclease VII large subunit